MPMMKSPFDQSISSIFGHVLVFEANEPQHVPDLVVPECLERGVRLTEDQPTAPVVAPEEKSDNGDDAEAEFAVALDGAILKILTRDDPSDLKADLTPKVSKVVAEMSPELRRPNATEVYDAYQRLQENIDLAE
jgi:hypothetical protein